MLNHLRLLGLSFYESKAWECLAAERLTAEELSKRAGIPFGKVYTVLALLEKRGLVEKANSRPRRFFVSDPSMILGQLMQENDEKNEKAYASLRQWSTSLALANSMKPRFFQTAISGEEQAALQLMVFNDARNEICQLFNSFHNPGLNRQAKARYEDAIATAVGRGVEVRAIYPENTELPLLLRNLNGFTVRRLDIGCTRCDIIDGRAVLFKIVHHDFRQYACAALIENEKLARAMKENFEEFWIRASGK